MIWDHDFGSDLAASQAHRAGSQVTDRPQAAQLAAARISLRRVGPSKRIYHQLSLKSTGQNYRAQPKKCQFCPELTEPARRLATGRVAYTVLRPAGRRRSKFGESATSRPALGERRSAVAWDTIPEQSSLSKQHQGIQ